MLRGEGEQCLHWTCAQCTSHQHQSVKRIIPDFFSPGYRDIFHINCVFGQIVYKMDPRSNM